jgi:hypothetical protein
MSKVYGLFSAYAPLREERSRTVACYDLQAEPDGEHATWHELYFYHKRDGKPTLATLRSAIEPDINRRTTERIVGTLSWNQKPVWLSHENQTDWKAAFDRALQTDGYNLPLRFKLGEDQDGQPIYHTFTSPNAFADFWDTCQRHIYQCLSDGWQQKDSIDWSLYGAGGGESSAEK